MLATLLLGFSTLAAAQSREAIDVASLGPQIGERVPDFNLPDQSGQVHSLDSIMGPNGVMLVFFRSADW
jgi:peroxiredoxin